MSDHPFYPDEVVNCVQSKFEYSKTPIYRRVWGKENICGKTKSGSAVNRGFVWFTLCMFIPIWAKEMAAVYRGFTILPTVVLVVSTCTVDEG